MRILPPCLLLVPAMVLSVQAESFEQMLGNGTFWTSKKSQLAPLFAQEQGRWNDSARSVYRIAQPGIKIGSLGLGEMLVSFDDKDPEGCAQRVDISLWNKGDNQPISREKFEQILKQAAEQIGKTTAVNAQDFTPKRSDTAVKISATAWKHANFWVLLESSHSGASSKNFEAEFIRLKIVPAGKDFHASQKVSRNDIRANVKADGSGFMVQNIPMVDQGQKGYCVVATVARVMGYYGLPVDQHEIAQIANSKAGGGTTMEEMKEGLKRVCGRLGIRMREIEMLEFKDYERLIRQYNRAAKAQGKPQLDEKTRDLGGIWKQFDALALKKARSDNKAEVARWTKQLKEQIDKGVPVFWTVMLGIVPEQGLPQDGGGHMRLLIGYDEKTGEVIFSDSWGAMHEKKRMKIEDAMTITVGRTYLLPN